MSQRYAISYWDAAILAAAEALGLARFTPRI
jgi:predicted nucleic acid-binding protein